MGVKEEVEEEEADMGADGATEEHGVCVQGGCHEWGWVSDEEGEAKGSFEQMDQTGVDEAELQGWVIS